MDLWRSGWLHPLTFPLLGFAPVPWLNVSVDGRQSYRRSLSVDFVLHQWCATDGITFLREYILIFPEQLVESCFLTSIQSTWYFWQVSGFGGFVSCTEYNWPISHLEFSIISLSDRLSSCMANLESWPRAGTPKSPSGRFVPGSIPGEYYSPGIPSIFLRVS